MMDDGCRGSNLERTVGGRDGCPRASVPDADPEGRPGTWCGRREGKPRWDQAFTRRSLERHLPGGVGGSHHGRRPVLALFVPCPSSYVK